MNVYSSDKCAEETLKHQTPSEPFLLAFCYGPVHPQRWTQTQVLVCGLHINKCLKKKKNAALWELKMKLPQNLIESKLQPGAANQMHLII